MNPVQWARLEDLFERGLDKSASERADLLQECADDPVVQRELENLWKHESITTAFLDMPPDVTHLVTSQALLAENDLVSGRFTVLEMIGSGGMGEVYRARDERLRRIVALKVLASRLSSDATYRKRLEQEARAVSSLSHPAICALHDLGTDGDLLYLVMEYVSGEALDVRLRRGAIPEPEAVQIALEICAGLQHAHANGIVHRDLKPANVMLSPHGVKLLDFGIAYRQGSAESAGALPNAETLTGLTGIGQIIGTPAYMSPEQAAGRPVDARSDIYSFGLLLGEMVDPAASFRPGGSRPAKAKTSISPELDRVLERCLEPDPEKRFQSVVDLSRALREVSRPAAEASGFRRWAAGAALLFFVTAGALWYTKSAESQTGQPHLSTLTAYPGTEFNPALSPDGSSVAFVWNGEEGNYDIYVRSIDSDSPVRLTSDPAQERTPEWSPDGRWIAFDRNSRIILISPFGGPERFVTTLEFDNRLRCDQRLGWSSDSKRIYFSREPRPGEPAAIHEVDIATGAVRALTRPEANSGGHWCPVASPDGKRLFYVRYDSVQSKYALAELGPQGVESEKEVPWVAGWSHAFTADSRDLIFSRNLPAAAFLFRAGLEAPQEARQLPFGEEGMYPEIARKGDRMVYMRRRMDVDIWRVPLPAAGKPAAAAAVKLIGSSRPDTQAEYSPDGTRIAFLSERGGKLELWVSEADGGPPKRLAICDSPEESPGWSPDGQHILYSYRGDLYRVRADGTANPEPILPGPAADKDPAYSRDGRWLYFASDRSGSRQIWRMPAAGGDPVQITTGGGYRPVESYDGSQLFFLRHEKLQDFLLVMPASGGTEKLISEVIMRPALAVTRQGVYFIPRSSLDDWAILSLYNSSSGAISPVLQLPKRQRGLSSGLSASRDGKQVLFSAYDMHGDLMLVDNFR